MDNFSFFQRLLCRRRMKAYKTADLKFLCGTNALYTNMYHLMPAWNINLFNSSIYSDTICMGVGLAPTGNKINLYTKMLYSKVFSHQYIHSVRDEASKLFLENLGFKAYNTGCPTMWGLTPEHCSRIPRKKSKSVIFTLTCYHPDLVNDKAMIDILFRNYQKIYFWPQSIDDLAYLRSLTDAQPIVVSPNLSAYDEVLNEDIDYVGNRLHGGIRALQHCKRAIIIAIDYRAQNISQTYSLPILLRESIISDLPDLINSEILFDIKGLDFNLINRWKSQFY